MKVAQPPLGTPINRNHPLAQGMVACWLLNEGGGLNCYDSTGRCPIPGVATSAAVSKIGTRGLSRTFAGGNTDSIDIGTQSALSLTSSACTMSAWVFYNGVNGTAYYVAADFDAAGAISSMLISKTNNTNKFQWGSSGFIIASSTLPTAGKWYHVVGTRSGATGGWTLNIYVNGVLETSTTTALNPGAQQQFKIGRPGGYTGTGFSWLGLIQNVMIYNRALSASEVRQLYTNPYQMFK